MSVTFAPEMDSMQYQISCECGMSVAKQVFPSFAVAYKALNPSNAPIPFAKPVTCEVDWCGTFGVPFRVIAVNEKQLSVNMNGGNAGRLLRMLGLHNGEELVGSVSGDEFLSRVEASLAGLPVVEGPRPQISFGGNYEGYLQDRLAELETVGAYAAARGAKVEWA